MRINSLKFRIALLTTLSVSALLLLFGWYNYATTKAQSTQEQTAAVARVVARLQLSLPGPLWNYETGFIAAALKSELADPGLKALIVKNKDKLIAAFDRSASGETAATQQEPQNYSVRSSHDITYEENGEKSVVAQLLVFTDDTVIEAQLDSLLVQTVIQIVLLDLCIIALLMLLLHSNVMRPLYRMNLAVYDLAQGDGDRKSVV